VWNRILNLACTLVDYQATQTLRRLHSCESNGGNTFIIVFITLKDTLEYCLVFGCVWTAKTLLKYQLWRLGVGISWACRSYHLTIFFSLPSLRYIFSTFCKTSGFEEYNTAWKKDYEKIITIFHDHDISTELVHPSCVQRINPLSASPLPLMSKIVWC
jgi:hypothetical protein